MTKVKRKAQAQVVLICRQQTILKLDANVTKRAANIINGLLRKRVSLINTCIDPGQIGTATSPPSLASFWLGELLT